MLLKKIDTLVDDVIFIISGDKIIITAKLRNKLVLALMVS